MADFMSDSICVWGTDGTTIGSCGFPITLSQIRTLGGPSLQPLRVSTQ